MTLKDEPHICPQCDTNENSIRTKDRAMKIEIELAEKLRKKGHCAYQK